MQKTTKKHSFSKALGLFCAIVMLIGALYVPMVMSASALKAVPVTDDTPFVFDFENVANSTESTDAAKGEEGIGYYGWGPAVATLTDAEGNKNNVLQHYKLNAAQSWGTSGGYRLNQRLEDGTIGVYELAPSSKYVVTFKIRVVSSAVSIAGSSASAKSFLSIGYNSSYDPNLSGSATNYVNGMKTTIPVIESIIDSDVFTLYDAEGNPTSYPYGEEWINVRYFINTPETFTADPALAFYGTKFHGFKAEIDDVTVTKIGANSGLVFLVDEYSGTEELVLGEIGKDVTLPDISDKAQSADHAFEGWYTDNDRTQKAEKVSFAAEIQYIYSRWKAPVSITFKDNLNGTEKTITGSAGDKFNYPADPVDSSNTSWFMGWFTDENFTTEHKSGKFGYANQTLYAYFKGKIPGLVQDFEDYTQDAWTPLDIAKDGFTAVYKSNYLYFYTTMSKQSEVVYGGNNAIKFEWNTDPSTNKEVKAGGLNLTNPESYEHSRYASWDNYFPIGKGIENNQTYTVSFKYKVEKGSQDVTFYLKSAVSNNIWGGAVSYADPQKVTLEPGDWKEYSYTFTTAMKTANDTMFLGVKLYEHSDVLMYIDDVKIEAFAQPYESLATIYNGIDKEPLNLKGERGEIIPIPELNHPMGADFKGWFYDSEFTSPAPDVPVFTRGSIKLYAKWLGYSGFVQDFENYTKSDKNPAKFTKNNGTPDDESDDYTVTYYSNYLEFYTTMSKQSDVVYGGDYAIKFHWNTDPAYNKDVSSATAKNAQNPDAYEQSRYSADDNYFNVGKGLENNQIYTVSFKYKVEKGAQDVKFYAITGVDNNAWGNRVIYSAPENVTLKPGDWKEYSFEITTNMKSANDSFFLGVKLTENEDVIMYFDDVKVKSVPNSEQVVMLVYTGYSNTPEKVIATKGSEMKLPTLNHPENAPFLGWFEDEAFTKPFTAEVFPNTNFKVYAKWGPYAMTFKQYPFEGHAYSDPFINRETAKNLGNGDDHAMHWKLKRVTANTTGVGTSQCFLIYSGLKSGNVYKVKYDYKVNNATLDGSIDVRGYDSNNIWWSNVAVSYDALKVTKGEKTGWETREVYINANVIEANGYQKSDDLFIRFNFTGTSEAGVNMDILIDNVFVEVVEAPYVFFDGQNGQLGTMVRGEVGDAIKLPKNPEKIGYKFAGWYYDRECTQKFDLKTFAADTAVSVYAKYTESNTATYSFENYTEIEGSNWHFRKGKVVKDRAKSGKYSMYFGDRTAENISDRSVFIVEDSGLDYELEKSRQYVITMYYYVKKYGDTPLSLTWQASSYNNIYVSLNAKNGGVGVTQPISKAEAAANKGKWVKKTFAIDTTVLTEKGADHKQLYCILTGGKDWEIYFDDVTITKVPKGKSVVAFDTMGAPGCPDYIMGNVGTDYSAKVPETMKLGEMYFKGYSIMTADGAWLDKKREEMKLGDKAEVVFGRFFDKYVVENFDGDYFDKAYGAGAGYTIHDFDYELYDAEKEGNSKDNVVSGRYSMHRKGNSMFNENACILTLGTQIAEGERYRVSMKVKLGKHFHTDGAIKIVSGRSYEYAWTTTGDYYSVAPIATLTEGQWTEVSYVFNSVEAFAVLQTPGYVELFIDDIKFEIVDNSVPLSEPPVYTEYIAAERDANGKLLKVDKSLVDISTIIDANLGKTESFPWIYVIAGGAALIVIALGTVLTVVIVKKKKNKAKA